MFTVQKVKNRDDLISYCMRKLGAPVIQINVDEMQVQDRINDALRMFFDYHVDGAERTYVIHKITDEDLTNKYITVPDNVLVVTNIMKTSGGNGSGFNLTNNLQMKAYFSDMISQSFTGGVSNYVMTKSYLNTFNSILGSQFTLIEHNFYKRKLTVHFDWDKLTTDSTVGYEAWVANDVDDVFGDYWLQQYATALIRKQWGYNLIKVDGMALPGGGRLNGAAILAEAKEEIADLEERMRDEFAYPIMPIMG